MAGEPVHTQADGELPPPSEEVHLPEPSYLPVFLAFGITIALVGVLLSWVICGIGVAILLVTLFKWIRSARQELSDLPLEH
jgi:ABC-type lipoprotein release transport system permease subunit